MVKTATQAMKLLEQGATIGRRWGGFRIGGKSILPRLVTELEEAGKIKRVDDRTSRCGEEWAKA